MKGGLEAAARQAWEIACHLLWPVTCPVCGRIASNGCPSCLDGLLHEMPKRCLWCGGGGFPCEIFSHTAFLRAGTWHEGEARELVHLAKYSGHRSLAFEMGRALARLYREESTVTLIPVPLHKGSGRSYNQAECLARGMSEVWKVPLVDGLKWTLPLPSQAGRNAFERRALPRGAFRWQGPRMERDVLIVDDVCTTGMTLLRAAEALQEAGISVKGAYCWSVSSMETLTVTWKGKIRRD
jgi:predicted amidophosphoribosyltransferase